MVNCKKMMQGFFHGKEGWEGGNVLTIAPEPPRTLELKFYYAGHNTIETLTLVIILVVAISCFYNSQRLHQKQALKSEVREGQRATFQRSGGRDSSNINTRALVAPPSCSIF